MRLTSNTQQRIKYTLLSGIILFAISPVFAADWNECTTASLTQQAIDGFNILLSLLSRLWIPLATFAGKLMWNGLLYGEMLNLDKVLYYLRNMSRTFANFAVLILIFWKIGEDLLGKKFDGGSMMKYILKVWWGLLLAHMSWFLIGATIDVSTILTTTVASLPSTFIWSQDNGDIRTRISQSIKNSSSQRKITLNLDTKLCNPTDIATITPETNNKEWTEQEILDTILPNSNSISWPLMYIWVGVLRIQDYMYNSNNSNTITDNLFIVLVRLAIILMYVFILVLLIVINIIRVVAVRFFVAFAPLLIVLKLAGKDVISQSEALKSFSIENIVKAIFAPVIAIGLMSIGLIVIVIMQWFLQINNDIERDDVKVSSSQLWSKIWVSNVFETTIAGDILGQDAGNNIKNTFTNILLIIFTLFILYGITQALTKFLKDGIWGKYIEQIGKLWSTALSSLPIIPWWISASGLWWTYRGMKDNILSKAKEKWFDLWWWANNAQDNRLQRYLDKSFGLPTSIWYEDIRPLELFTKKLQRKNYINKEDIANFMKDYQPIKEYYKEAAKQNIKNSLSSMSGISNSFPILLQKIISNQSSLQSEYSGLQLEAWKENDNISNYIKENYNKGRWEANKKFFNSLYKQLGWDDTKLKTGADFWDKPFQRKND